MCRSCAGCSRISTRGRPMRASRGANRWKTTSTQHDSRMNCGCCAHFPACSFRRQPSRIQGTMSNASASGRRCSRFVATIDGHGYSATPADPILGDELWKSTRGCRYHALIVHGHAGYRLDGFHGCSSTARGAAWVERRLRHAWWSPMTIARFRWSAPWCEQLRDERWQDADRQALTRQSLGASSQRVRSSHRRSNTELEGAYRAIRGGLPHSLYPPADVLPDTVRRSQRGGNVRPE